MSVKSVNVSHIDGGNSFKNQFVGHRRLKILFDYWGLHQTKEKKERPEKNAEKKNVEIKFQYNDSLSSRAKF